MESCGIASGVELEIELESIRGVKSVACNVYLYISNNHSQEISIYNDHDKNKINSHLPTVIYQTK